MIYGINYKTFIKVDSQMEKPYLKAQPFTARTSQKLIRRDVIDFSPSRLVVVPIVEEHNEEKFDMKEQPLLESLGQTGGKSNALLVISPLYHLWEVYQPLHIPSLGYFKYDITLSDLESESLPLNEFLLAGGIFYIHGADSASRERSLQDKIRNIRPLTQSVKENAFINLGLMKQQDNTKRGIALLGRLRD